MDEIIPKTMREPISLRVYLLRLIAGILLINLFVVGLVAYSLYQSRQLYENRVVTQAQNLSNSLNLTLASIIDKTSIAVFSVKKEMERQLRNGRVDNRSVNEYILDQKNNISELDGLRVSNSQGELVYGDKVDPAAHVSFADRDVFVWAKEDSKTKFFVGPPVFGRISKQWVFQVASRINNPDGTFAGCVFGAISIEDLKKIVSTIDLGKSGNITLRYHDFTVMMRYPDPPGKSSIGNKSVSKELQAFIQSGKTSGTYITFGSIDSVKRVFSFNKVSNYPLYVIAGLATKDYLAPWSTEAQQMLSLVLLFSSGSVVATWLLYRNRKRSINTEALTEERNYLHTLFEHNGSGHLIVSSSRKILQVNQFFCKMFGYSEDELIGQSAEVLHLDHQHFEDWSPFFEIARDSQNSTSAEYQWRRKDGSIFWCIFTGVKLQLPNGDSGVVWSVIDVTERKKTDEALAESEENYRNLFNLATDGILILDTEGNLIDANKTAYERLGYTREELLSLHIRELDHPDFAIHAPSRLQQIDDQRTAIFESGHLRKDGSMMPVEVNSRLLEYKGQQVYFSVIRDITERKRLEEEQQSLEKQLLHAQKLESLGVLAGGIAHDFNNILMAIIGNADLALMRINKESPVIDNLHKIEQAAARAADLAKQMLAYSGKGKFVIEDLDLNILLEEMLHMLEVSISKKAVLRLNHCSTLPTVEADATQIRQIVMNLVINASEAIGEKSGVIAISTGCMDCDESYLKDVWLAENLTGGLYVYLEVADNGCGMDKTTLSKLFDPFFTTKFTGRGLGMAAVHGIVRGHKGAIRVYSESGKGSTFKILLPASNRPPEIFNGNPHNDDWKGHGKVLLVDDEETVRGIGSEMLKELGFTPITANDGREAVEQFNNNPDIVFVILDLTMPHMDGEQCFRELRKLKSDVKVIISSGFSEHEVTQKFAGKGLSGFIQKPYKLSVLKETIQSIYH